MKSLAASRKETEDKIKAEELKKKQEEDPFEEQRDKMVEIPMMLKYARGGPEAEKLSMRRPRQGDSTTAADWVSKTKISRFMSKLEWRKEDRDQGLLGITWLELFLL